MFQAEGMACAQCVCDMRWAAPCGCCTCGLLFQGWPVPYVMTRSPSPPVPVTAVLEKHRGIDSHGAAWRSLLLDAVLSGVASGICFGLERECRNRTIRRCGQNSVSFACVVLSFTMIHNRALICLG